MRTKFAIALAIVAVCVTAAWAGWNDEFQITDNGLTNRTGGTGAHYAVIGEGGVVHVVWTVDQASGDYLYYKRYYPGSGWSEELEIGSGGSGGLGPCPGIALDANGRDIHVVWRSTRTSGKGRNKVTDQTVYYSKCVVTGPGNGGWDDSPTDLCVNRADGYYGRWDPCIACGADGQVVVAWEEFWRGVSPTVHSVVFREYVSGAWQDEQVLTSSDQYASRWTSIAAGDNGDVFVSYVPYAVDAQLSVGHVFVKRRISGTWYLDNVTPELDSFGDAAIEVSPEYGHPHLVCTYVGWNGEYITMHIYHTYRTDDGWVDLGEPISDLGKYQQKPHMFFFGDMAHVVWEGRALDDAYYCIKYAACPYEGGTWTAPVDLVTNDAGTLHKPDIAGGTDGALLAVWERLDIIAKKKGEEWKYNVCGMYNTTGGDGGQAEPMALSRSCVELFPNPARAGHVAVHYSLPRAGQMTAKLLDVSGRVVKTREAAAAGLSGSFTLDAAGLEPGVYVVRIESGTTSQTQKLVIN